MISVYSRQENGLYYVKVICDDTSPTDPSEHKVVFNWLMSLNNLKEIWFEFRCSCCTDQTKGCSNASFLLSYYNWKRRQLKLVEGKEGGKSAEEAEAEMDKFVFESNHPNYTKF